MENDIWLIAGLGNPEKKYEGTRQNIRLYPTTFSC